MREYVNRIFDNIEDAVEKRAAYVHSYGVSQCCALLALRRGLDLEMAAVIGLLHDVYSYRTGYTRLHSHNGAEMVRVAFKHDLKDFFLEDEQTIIKSAIYHHSDKDHVHDEYDELLKDSDVVQHLSFDTAYEPIRAQRLLHTLNELALPMPNITVLAKERSAVNLFSPTRAADVAEALAGKEVTGERHDPDYMKIVRYFPEDTAPEEFKNAWCAAFVYHCCLEAGLPLPIRVGHTAMKMASGRFGGVRAWYEWGMENGFCRYEKDGFTPQRGDIVIYDNVIPAENKDPNSAAHDHMGIVLACGSDSVVVAEGNVGNKNVSGIVSRKRGDTIGCYIRIPEDYSYDGWRIDFKTGRTRVEGYLVD
ncbi:MAG: HD domain-containing protein [Bacillota bacterium]